MGRLDVGQGNRVVAREQQRVWDHVLKLALVAWLGLALQERLCPNLGGRRGHL